MSTKSSASELTRLINQLRLERQHHLDSIAEIDQTFKEFGIVIPGGGAGAPKGGVRGKGKGKGRGKAAGKTATAATTPGAEGEAPAATKGRGKGKGKGKGKGRGKGKAPKKAAGGAPRSPWASKFPITGDQLIIDFVRDKGGATTEEIRKHWEGSGRRGKAENNLTNLVKGNKLKRSKVEGKPGSVYSLP